MFSHGRLRLYLLKLLAEGPKHGYELIRLVEDTFQGLYAPSAGTIYPRLQRLEAEGLVTHAAAGGRKVYQITDRGRAELRDRAGELAALESDIRTAVAGLVEVARSVRDVGVGLRDAARRASAGWRQAAESAGIDTATIPAAVELERRVSRFAADVRELARGIRLDENTVRAVGRALDAALDELRRSLDTGRKA